MKFTKILYYENLALYGITARIVTAASLGKCCYQGARLSGDLK